LSLLTLNVEAYEDGSRDEIKDRIHEIGADVICVQEDVFKKSMKFRQKQEIISCQTGEKIDGKQNTWLANSIYSFVPLVNAKTLDIQESSPVGRCAVMVQVANGVTIANVHLSGGRFDDIHFRHLIHTKTMQLRTVVEKWHPDIICGDFNGEPNIRSLRTHPVFKTLSTTDKLLYAKYHTDGHHYLKKEGYVSVNMEKSTSRFGGTPDHIYFNPNAVKLHQLSLVPFLDLSDHNGIWARFTVI